MSNARREEIFAQAAKKIRIDFQELSIIPHNALKGHEAESIVKKFLEDHIPKRFSVGGGFVLDPLGNISRQTDIIIYDAFNCPVYRASDDASIFPSNNVAAVVEVKSSLDKNELIDAWDKISAIKALAKSKPSEGPCISQTAGFLFAFDSKISLTKLSEHYVTLFNERGIGHHIDVIIVLDKGILTLIAKLPGIDRWNIMFMEGLGGAVAEGSHIGVSVGLFEEYTLDAFFRILIPRLSLFRHIVDHPGFQFDQMPIKRKEQMIHYMFSITEEKDPKLRQEKLKKYAEQVRQELSGTPLPKDWEK